MGAIQNAANSLAQTGLGAAVAAKHLNQQAESIKQQEATKKLAGLNAAASTQSQLNEANVDLDKVGTEFSGNVKESVGAMNKLLRERVRAGNTTTDSHGRRRDAAGQFYSTKSLDEAYNAVVELDATRIGITENARRILAHRQAILAKAQGINEIYGEKIVDIPGQHGEVIDKLSKKYPEMFSDKALKPGNFSKEPLKRYNGPDQSINEMTKGGKK